MREEFNGGATVLLFVCVCVWLVGGRLRACFDT